MQHISRANCCSGFQGSVRGGGRGGGTTFLALLLRQSAKRTKSSHRPPGLPKYSGPRALFLAVPIPGRPVRSLLLLLGASDKNTPAPFRSSFLQLLGLFPEIADTPCMIASSFASVSVASVGNLEISLRTCCRLCARRNARASPSGHGWSTRVVNLLPPGGSPSLSLRQIRSRLHTPLPPCSHIPTEYQSNKFIRFEYIPSPSELSIPLSNGSALILKDLK